MLLKSSRALGLGGGLCSLRDGGGTHQAEGRTREGSRAEARAEQPLAGRVIK